MKATQDATSGADTSSTEDPLAVLHRLGAELCGVADDLVPERVPGHRVRDITSALTAIERQARGIRLVLRKAAAETGDWKAKGHKSPAEQVAKEEGISVGQAKGEIEASARLADQPQARQAAGRGEISPETAAVVAAGAAADPSQESTLVRTAKRGDLHATRKRAQEAITRADERSGEQAKRIRQRRSLKAWMSLDGEGHGRWNIPAEYQARFLAALQPYRRAAFRAARASGEHLTDEQLMADALDMLARDVMADHQADIAAAAAPTTEQPEPDAAPAAAAAPGNAATPAASDPTTAGPGAPGDAAAWAEPSLFDTDPASGGASRPATSPDTRTGPGRRTTPATEPIVVPTAGRRPSTPAPRNRRAPAQVHVLVDFDALRRGYATTGETCEIHGIGPVPVSLAEHLMQDALLRLIVTGTDINLVSSQRRYVPDPLRRALFARDKGRCVVCGSDRYLELHHYATDHAKGGPTEHGNLAHICSREHALATHCGWTLHHTDHGWDFRPPTSTDHTGTDPP